MNKFILIGFLIVGFITNGCCTETLVDHIKFATVKKANELLQQEDEFTKSWSQFDIDSRMQKSNSKKEELFSLITQQTREWTFEEKNMITAVLKNIDNQILKQAFKIDFPDEIYFIKTTTDEEGGANGYTRASYIVLKEDLISRSKEELTHLIVHELFHILTRNNPEFRKEMYQIIGFELMNNVDYPDDLKAYRITNPDAPQTDSYIQLKVGEHLVDCMMILYSTQDYDGGDFFKYLTIAFLSLEGDAIKSVKYGKGKPEIFTFKQVTGFFEQVGKNTQYIIHPEEIMADNFAFSMLNQTRLANPEIVEKIKMVLVE